MVGQLQELEHCFQWHPLGIMQNITCILWIPTGSIQDIFILRWILSRIHPKLFYALK